MKTYLDCLPCFVLQALRAGRIATEDETVIKKLIGEVGMLLKDIPLGNTPPETGRLVYEKVREITGNSDPYRSIKAESTKKALTLYPALKERLQSVHDRLLMAIRIAISGNVIDFGVTKEFDIETEVEEVLNKEFAVFDYDEFKSCLQNADSVLFIGDNAGECVFDRILIEEIGKPTIYAVRDVAVINDATIEDALEAGIDSVATIQSSGTSAPGTILSTCSEEFISLYNDAQLIISKGQGNYEALSNETGPIFFLLKAKCGVIAKDLCVEEGDIILNGQC